MNICGISGVGYFQFLQEGDGSFLERPIRQNKAILIILTTLFNHNFNWEIIVFFKSRIFV